MSRRILSHIMISSLLFIGIAVMPGCKSNTANTVSDCSLAFDSIQIDAIISIPLDLSIKGDTLLVNQFNGENFLK